MGNSKELSPVVQIPAVIGYEQGLDHYVAVLNEIEALEPDWYDFGQFANPDATAVCLRDYSQYRPLGAEQVQTLFKIIEIFPRESTLPDRARTQAILHNQRLVISIAKGAVNHGVPLLDLVQGGNLGLFTAVDKFDYHQGNKFSTYATWWISRAVARTAISHKGPIRQPYHLPERLRRIYDAEETLLTDKKRQPTASELAQESKTSEKTIERIWIMKSMIALEQIIGDHEEELGDVIADDPSLNPEVLTANLVLQHIVNELLLDETLNPREAKVLKLYFGLVDGQDHIYKEVGRKIGLTGERIRTIANEALEKIKKSKHYKQLLDFARNS